MKVSEEFEQALSRFRQVLRTGCWSLVNCGAAKYRCEAFKEGRSCFQVPSTPCCDVNRQRCISCPVFIRLVELPKRPHRVLVTTDNLRIEADFHCPVGMRILDALNVDHREFIALTDATVAGLGGDSGERQVPFLALSRGSIRALIPLSATGEAESNGTAEGSVLPDIADREAAAPVSSRD
jgi:hypothetical protein